MPLSAVVRQPVNAGQTVCLTAAETPLQGEVFSPAHCSCSRQPRPENGVRRMMASVLKWLLR